DANIDVLSLRTGQRKTVVRGGYFGRYLPSGHLVFIRQGTLFGAPFDPARLEVKGAPTPLLEGIAASFNFGGGQFDFSRNGTFVYLGGKAAQPSDWQLLWMDKTGKTEPLIATPATYLNPRIS